ncbi:MAG: alpha-L-fucosidase, partial [Spirochaetales bacterium]|nr:alpha-L-fucosidase [Spirochaetales bacterium]
AYTDRWWNITTEMVEKYDPDLYYFDWGWNTKYWDKERPRFGAFYYNHAIKKGMGSFGDPQVVLNYKNNSFALGAAVNDIERGSRSSIQKHVWQTDTSISDHSWGYSADDTFKTPKDLICMLVDIVSNNGVLMLNFGPKADGTVPEECKHALLEMGKWLQANGDAVYATRPWKLSTEGPTGKKGHDNPAYIAKDIRYTLSKDGKTVFATAFGWPSGKLTLQLTKVIKESERAKITLLANGANVPYEINLKGQLVLNLTKLNPEKAGCNYAYSFAIEGIEMDARNLDPIDLADTYMLDVKNYDPLPGTHTSQFPYLSAADGIFEKAHKGVKRDSNYSGKATVTIGGKEYKQSLMVCPHAHGKLGIFIVQMDKLPPVTGFTADIGIDDAVKKQGSSAFWIDVKVDGHWKRIYESKVLTHKDAPVTVDVDFPAGTEYVRFVTTDGGNGCSADHAVWADAQFKIQ